VLLELDSYSFDDAENVDNTVAFPAMTCIFSLAMVLPQLNNQWYLSGEINFVPFVNN
jgi:hypothetical protein